MTLDKILRSSYFWKMERPLISAIMSKTGKETVAHLFLQSSCHYKLETVLGFLEYVKEVLVHWKNKKVF